MAVAQESLYVGFCNLVAFVMLLHVHSWIVHGMARLLQQNLYVLTRMVHSIALTIEINHANQN